MFKVFSMEVIMAIYIYIYSCYNKSDLLYLLSINKMELLKLQVFLII